MNEDWYEKLLQSSQKRHLKDENRNIESGEVSVYGEIAKYKVKIKDSNHQVSLNINYDGKNFSTHLMSEENFIQMSKDEQRSACEYKIKKVIKDKVKLTESKTKLEDKIKLIENVMETLDIEGVCHYWVYEESFLPTVYIILDLDWLNDSNTSPDFIAHRTRIGIKEEIKSLTGIDVYVGSTVKKCYKNNDKIVEMEQSQISDLIKETLTEDAFILQRKIHVLNEIITNFEKIDCSGSQTKSYQRVYCEKMKNLSKNGVISLKDSYEEKLKKLIKSELKKNLKK